MLLHHCHLHILLQRGHLHILHQFNFHHLYLNPLLRTKSLLHLRIIHQIITVLMDLIVILNDVYELKLINLFFIK